MRFCSRALATLAVAIAISTVGANTGFGQRSDEAPKVEVGKKAPDFTMTNIEGKSFKLSERLGKDKNIVLMFSRAHW